VRANEVLLGVRWKAIGRLRVTARGCRSDCYLVGEHWPASGTTRDPVSLGYGTWPVRLVQFALDAPARRHEAVENRCERRGTALCAPSRSSRLSVKSRSGGRSDAAWIPRVPSMSSLLWRASTFLSRFSSFEHRRCSEIGGLVQRGRGASLTGPWEQAQRSKMAFRNAAQRRMAWPLGAFTRSHAASASYS
jgi:hypothetical protein